MTVVKPLHNLITPKATPAQGLGMKSPLGAVTVLDPN